MNGPQGARAVSDLLERHGVAARKSLGQHFLADPNLVRKVVALAQVPPGSRVVEVGAGTGTLTRALAESGWRVRSYEVDVRLKPLLDEVLAGREDVEVRFTDALQALPDDLEDGPWTMVANLPYNVGTPLLLHILRYGNQVTRFVVMVQKEVADRLAAAPGTRSYGIPSVIAALHAEVKRAFTVPPRVFVPPPRVSSAVVTLQRRTAAPRTERAIELAAAAFNQRRKMVRRSLSSVLEDATTTLAAAGIPGDARAERLAPSDYLRLAEVEVSS